MLKKLTIAGLVAATFTSVTAQESPYPDTLVVLDVSNSMWGQIGGVSKIQIARNVLTELVDGLETESEFGLMAYGHREKADCGDIETVLPVGPLDAESFTAAVNQLVPRGRTPLVAAVVEAAQDLQYQTRSGRIVLVTDGTESCDGNLASVADELGNNSLDFTAHVIAFDVANTDDQAELSYLAEQTGGLFVRADSTEELKSALQSMMGDMDEEQAAAASVSAAGPVMPRSNITVEYTGPMGGGDYIGLSNVGAPADAVLAIARVVSGGSVVLIAPRETGSYELRYYNNATGEVLATHMIEVQ